MGMRALERWRAIERESGEQFILRTGAVSVGDFAEHQVPLLRATGIEAQLLSADDASRRFGARLPGDRPLLFQEEAGVIRADRALAALLGLARKAGAELCAQEVVKSIQQRSDDVVVETERRRWRAAATIVSAGPWSVALLANAGIRLPLTISRQAVAYFHLAEPGARPVALIDYEGPEPYALWDPARGLKAAFHARGPLARPDDPTAGDPAMAEQLRAWVEQHLPGMTKGLTAVESCLYTNSPDEQFIFERNGGIIAGAVCNGQGFSLAPETGRRLVELALEPAGVAPR
jgi:glycine/D-amino acid oxidase-like deaminating enzyme